MTQENDSRQLPLPHVEKVTPPWMETTRVDETRDGVRRDKDELRRTVALVLAAQAHALDCRRELLLRAAEA